MATEAALLDHHSPDKTVEKVDVETGTVKLEGVDPPKEAGPKDEEEKLDADGLGGSETLVNKLEETAGMQTKLPAAVEVEKVEEDLVVDICESEKTENCALNPESLSKSGGGSEAVETQSGDPEKECVVAKKVNDSSPADVPAEVDLKVVDNILLEPESDSASKLGGEIVERTTEVSEELTINVLKVDDGLAGEIPTETGSEVVESSGLEQESSSTSEPGGEIVETKLEGPKGYANEVEKIDDVPAGDISLDTDLKVVENSGLDQESSSSSEPGVETVETQPEAPEAHANEAEKINDCPVGDIPTETDLKVVENSVLNQESSSAPEPEVEIVGRRLEAPKDYANEVEKIVDVSVRDIPAETDSKAVESSVLNQESSSAPEPEVEIVKRQQEAPKDYANEVEKIADVPVGGIPAENDSKAVESSVLNQESSSAPEPGFEIVERQLEVPKGYANEVEKIADVPVGDFPAETDSKVVENSVPDQESSSAPEPEAEIVERQLEVPKNYANEVEKVSDVPVGDIPAETESKVVVNSAPDQESLSSSGPGGGIVEGQLEAPKGCTIEVKKVGDGPAGDTPSEVDSKVVTDSVLDQESSSLSEPGGEIVETQPQEEVASGAIEQPEEKPSVGTAEPDLSIEKIAEPVENLEVISVKESELEVAKVPEADCKIAESPGLYTKAEEDATEGAEVVKEVKEETGEIEPSESLGSKVMAALNEEKICLDQKPVAYENSVPTNQVAQIAPKEEEGSSCASDITEKAASRSADDDVVKSLSNDDTKEAAKVEDEKEEQNVKFEDSEGKSVEPRESVQTETAKIYDRKVSNSAAEVAEIDTQQVSRDVEVVAEMKKMENIKEDLPLSVEAGKDQDGKGKLSEVDAKEIVKTNAANLGSAEEDGETEKSNLPDSETLKNCDDSKPSGKPPKQDDPAKKHSSNLISKVKHSIVKVKKAIIGKSPSSKALSPEAKGVEKVK